MNDHGNSGRFQGWLRLIRPPNLLTVPGDPLAGFFLASCSKAEEPFPALLLCVPISLLLYIAGLISNDYFDLAEDRKDRPNRPLPSGQVSPRAALTVAVLISLISLAMAALVGRETFIISAVLLVSIGLYNIKLKRVPFLGPFNMGACRGISLLLGASAAGTTSLTSPLVLASACLVTLYIAAITVVAVNETSTNRIGYRRWLPLFSVIIGLGLVVSANSMMFGELCGGGYSPWHGLSLACFASVLITTGRAGHVLGKESTPVPAVIGRLIIGLIPVQATLLFISSCPLTAIGVLCLWPISSLLARKFYSS